MYEIIPTSDSLEDREPTLKVIDKTFHNGVRNSSTRKEKLDAADQNTSSRTTKNCEDSGYDDHFESDVTEKTGLLSDVTDSSPDTAQLDQESLVYGIGESGINYHDYAVALKDVRKQVDRRENGKKKKVRINEDITDVTVVPHRYDYCVNYRSGYYGYTEEGYSDNRSNNKRIEKNRCYYRYCFDTKNSGRHLTARWEEEDEYDLSHDTTKKPSDDVNVKITVTDTTEPNSTEEESKVIHPSSDPTDSASGHWPLKRSQSVDSRDNPFLPGGELSKEAEEILSRATIIRDKFILKDNESKLEHNPSSSPKKPEPESEQDALPVEETVSAEVANMAESVANARPKENGQITESEDSLTPGSVKMELMEENKDKKKQKKCCTIM